MHIAASTIVMIEPNSFQFNIETSPSNTFQHIPNTSQDIIQQNALKEFHSVVAALQHNNIKVIVQNNDSSVHKQLPDEIFPNNWFSTHTTGEIILYPLAAPNRRNERNFENIEALRKEFGYTRCIDFTIFEQSNEYLEGTGSLVLDRLNKVCYAALSQRTDRRIIEEWCRVMDYKSVVFETIQLDGMPIYHTNVIMSIGSTIAVVCMDSIIEKDREILQLSFKQSGHKLIEITIEQLKNFAGNILELSSNNDKTSNIFWIMSTRAYASFTQHQLSILQSEAKIIHVDIPTIEHIGGGGIRCMIAEIFQPNNTN